MVFEEIKSYAKAWMSNQGSGLKNTNSATPILMLPLRTEVKFLGDELLIRVYPDTIAIEQHEEQLTENEKKAGENYWKTYWGYVQEKEKKEKDFRDLWARISNFFGAQRAEWIIRQTQPVSWKSGLQLQFPNLKTKSGTWTQPAVCRVLPERLVICFKPEGEADIVMFSGLPIPPLLQVSPKPNEFTTDIQTQNDKSDFNYKREIAWMVDFNEAENKGMGFRKSLLPETNRIEWLFVFGVKTFENPERMPQTQASLEGLKAVDHLIQSHYYSKEGFSLIPQGTATKNNEQKSVPAPAPIGFHQDHYQRVIKPSTPTVPQSGFQKPDQQMLAEALGIWGRMPGAELLKKTGPFYAQYFNGARDYHEAVAMNKALFPATLGYYTEVMLGNPFGNKQVSFRDWFNSYVVGRGLLPAVKVGKQPYGILPTTYFPGLRKPNNLLGFQNLMQALDEYLDRLGPGIKDVSANVPLDKKLADMLLLHPTSERYWLRLTLLHRHRDADYSPEELSKFYDQLERLNNNEYSIESIFHEDIIFQKYTKPVFNYTPSSDFGFEELAEDRIRIPLVTEQALSEVEPLPLKQEVPILTYTKDLNYIEWIKLNYIYAFASHFWGVVPSREFTRHELERAKVFPTNFGKETLLARYLMHAILHQVHKCAYLWLRDQKDAIAWQIDGIRMHDIFEDDAENPKKYHYNLKEIWPKENITIPLDLVFAPLKMVFRPNDALGKFNNIVQATEYFRIFAYDNITVGEHIYYLNGEMLFEVQSQALKSELAYLTQLKSSLNTLAHMPTARLERCLVEHFDVLSYRMDAWRMAFTFDKLREDRNIKSFSEDDSSSPAGGLYVGAYGWLLGIQRDAGKRIITTDVLDKTTKTEEKELLQQLDISEAVLWEQGGGFVHAPSLAQATAGAILKSAHTRYQDIGTDVFAVNLSSARVRQGLYLLEGIQQGMDLGTLLGYQFERAMHDAELDRLIFDFRSKYPLTSGKLTQLDYQSSTGQLESGGTWPVTDGLALLEDYKQLPKLSSIHDILKDVAPETVNGIIYPIIENLNNSVDALKDLLAAESIYQYAEGNIERAASVLQSVSNLEVPPVLEFIKTPRNTSQNVVNRVAIMFDYGDDKNYDQTDNPNEPGSKSLWAEIDLTPRAQAEPKLNHWLGKIMGNPSHIECLVTQLDANKIPVSEVFINVAALGLQPIDLIYLSSQAAPTPETLSGGTPTYQAGASELEQRIIVAFHLLYKKNEALLLSRGNIRINFSKCDKGKCSFAQCYPLWKYLKEVVGNARPMRALDFEVGTNYYPKNINYNNYNVETSVNQVIDVGKLNTRLTALKEILATLQQTLGRIEKGHHKLKISSQILFFWQAAGFGIADAVLQVPVEPTDGKVFQDYLISRATVVLKQIKQRLEDIGKFQGGFEFSNIISDKEKDTNYYEDRVDRTLALMKTVFNGTIDVFPVFMLGHNRAHEFGFQDLEKRTSVGDALANQDRLLQISQKKSQISSSQLVLEGWLSGAAEVRPNLYTLEMVKLLYESNGLENKLPLQLIQAPFEASDTWNGGPFNDEKRINTDKPSLVTIYSYNKENFPRENGFSGLIVDEWTEIIPRENEVTGIAINHDQSLSHVPQALLLAVSSNPDGTKPWTMEEVGATILYTLSRAMMRGNTTDKILGMNNLGRSLPALYAEFMPDGRNMSLEFLRD